MINFHSLEVVGRGSETQLQESENSKLFNLALKDKNYIVVIVLIACVWSGNVLEKFVPYLVRLESGLKSAHMLPYRLTILL